MIITTMFNDINDKVMNDNDNMIMIQWMNDDGDTTTRLTDWLRLD
jgi:hypothetical protein